MGGAAVFRVDEALARIEIPLTFFSVPVNVWVLRAERALLVDTGPRTDPSRERLHAGLRELGLAVGDVGSVIVTHHHIDHSGLLAELASHGARGFCHEDELEATVDVPGSIDRKMAGYRSLAVGWGVPEELVDRLCRHLARFGEMGGVTPRSSVTALPGDEAEVPIAGATLRAIHVPGHSEGQIVLHDRSRNVLFSADHVLERVTPNPNVYTPPYRGQTNGLADYVASLERLRALPGDVLVCPGHGAPFTGLHARIDRILEHHEERLGEVLRFLEDGAGHTVHDIAKRVWPVLKAGDVGLACREIHGHLDLLLRKSAASREDEAGAWVFRRVA
jgi:glyoxylase-like metal-dependent hydrolase (beta-lactamase superfamily II)